MQFFNVNTHCYNFDLRVNSIFNHKNRKGLTCRDAYNTARNA
jgi:hypothetical protein